MAKKQEQENAADMLRQFDSLKQKHHRKTPQTCCGSSTR